MRVRVVATVAALLLSSSLVSTFAQNSENPPSGQPQATPVQPERTPQQSDQAREQDKQRSEDVRVGRDWKAEPSDRDRQQYDRDERAMRRNSRPERDDERYYRDRDWDRRYGDRGSNFDERRVWRRVKTCVEYENGDEYCHSR